MQEEPRGGAHVCAQHVGRSLKTPLVVSDSNRSGFRSFCAVRGHPGRACCLLSGSPAGQWEPAEILTVFRVSPCHTWDFHSHSDARVTPARMETAVKVG